MSFAHSITTHSPALAASGAKVVSGFSRSDAVSRKRVELAKCLCGKSAKSAKSADNNPCVFYPQISQMTQISAHATACCAPRRSVCRALKATQQSSSADEYPARRQFSGEKGALASSGLSPCAAHIRDSPRRVPRGLLARCHGPAVPVEGGRRRFERLQRASLARGRDYSLARLRIRSYKSFLSENLLCSFNLLQRRSMSSPVPEVTALNDAGESPLVMGNPML